MHGDSFEEPTSAAQVRIRDLSKVYAGQAAPAVDRVSLSVARGEMLALLGPSGCGKTTILRMIAGLIEPTAGSIMVGGREIAGVPVHRRGIGMVFQAYALFPHMTVAENVAFGLEMRKVPKAERIERVARALQLVHLADKGDRRIAQLSGGQQQRTALARSLVVEPSILLLDEPLSNLDAKLRDEMRAEIRDIQRRTGITAIFVTHDQDEALSMADRIAVMSAGRIEQLGTPAEIYDHPQTRFVAGFIGRGNFLDGPIVALADGVATVEVAGLGRIQARAETRSGERVTLMIRPHRIEIGADNGGAAPGDGVVRGIVESVVYTGELQTSTVRVGDARLDVDSLTRGWRAAPGDSVALSWSLADVSLLAPAQGSES